MSTLPYDEHRLAEAAGSLITHCRELAHLGLTPATSSNFSQRLDATHCAITVSGRDKGRLVQDDILVVNFDGVPVGTQKKPSAETLLHTQLYRRFADIGCVLHTHSKTQTVASRLFARQGHITFEGYELQKAFRGNSSHESAVRVPVFANTQDMPTLAAQVEAELDHGPLWGYLIEGHGLYAWGRDMSEARRHLDAFEFLLGCELELKRLTR